MKEVFKTETKLTEHSFKEMMLYKKIYENKLEFIVKLSMCIFIVIAIWFVEFEISEKVFYIIMACLGIEDILKVKEKKLKDVSKLQYSFFQDMFQVCNGKIILEIRYADVDKIIITRKYCFLYIEQEILAIDLKETDTKNGNELLKFLKTKVIV